MFEALRYLTQQGLLAHQIEFRFVGWVGESTVQSIKDFGLQQHISLAAPVCYLPSINEMADADVLVVIDADFESSPFLPSKLFDYLLFDKPY